MEGQLDDVLQILWNASLTRQDMMLPSYDAEKGLKYLQVGCLCHLVIEPTLPLTSPFEGILLLFFNPFSDTPKSHKYDYTILIVSPLSPHKHCDHFDLDYIPLSKKKSIIIYHNYHHRCIYILHYIYISIISHDYIPIDKPVSPFHPHSIPIFPS